MHSTDGNDDDVDAAPSLTLQHYSFTTLQHYNITALQHYNITTLQLYSITTLQLYSITTMKWNNWRESKTGHNRWINHTLAHTWWTNSFFASMHSKHSCPYIWWSCSRSSFSLSLMTWTYSIDLSLIFCSTSFIVDSHLSDKALRMDFIGGL